MAAQPGPSAAAPTSGIFVYRVWECPRCDYRGPDIPSVGLATSATGNDRFCPRCMREDLVNSGLVRRHVLDMLPVLS